MKLREFTEPECEYFRKMCNFSDEERAVFDKLVKGKSVIQITFALNMSEGTVHRRIRAVKDKIIRVL